MSSAWRKEAEAHSAEDKAKREEIEARNQLDGLVYSVEKMLRENGDKISCFGARRRGERYCRCEKGAESNDKQQMDQARERLTQASHKLAEQMYQAAQPQTASGAAAGLDIRWTGKAGRGGRRRRVC